MPDGEIKAKPAALLRIFIPFGLGYFLSYLFRTVNAVIAPDLAADLSLDANDLGFLTSVYFLAFAAFQLPLGILLDRFGPRRTEAVLLVFAAAGAFLFSLSHSIAGLTAGRALIGLGVSACLMASFKAFAQWFPKHRLPLANGVIMTAGGLGALAATLPVEASLQLMDWRAVFFVLGVATLAVSAIVMVSVPEKNLGRSGVTWRDELTGVRQIFSSRVFWRIAPVTLLSQAAFLSIQSLWAGPWLRDVAGLDRASVAAALLVIAGAMIAGYLAIGALTERIARHGVKPMSVVVAGMVFFMATQSALIYAGVRGDLPAALIVSLWILFGFFGTVGIVPYAALSQAFPIHLAGRVTIALNLLVFLAAFAGQSGIGMVINLWPLGDANTYAPDGYSAAFSIGLMQQALGLVWYFVGRARYTAASIHPD